MDKQGVYDFLTQKGVVFERHEHEAVYSMNDLEAESIPNAEYDAKNLFVKESNGTQYFLITVRGNKRTDLKAVRAMFETKRLEFCKEGDLSEKLGIYPGAVSPMCIFNNDACDVHFVMDEDFFKDKSIIGCHPNDNTATIFMDSKVLLSLVKEHGNSVEVIKIPEKA